MRDWFHADPHRWGDFRKKYLAELKAHREAARDLAEKAKKQHVTLVYGARDEKHNNAVVLAQYLKMLGK